MNASTTCERKGCTAPCTHWFNPYGTSGIGYVCFEHLGELTDEDLVYLSGPLEERDE